MDFRAQEELLHLETSRNNLNKKKSKTRACMQVNRMILYLKNNVFLFKLLLIFFCFYFSLENGATHQQSNFGVMLEVLEEKV